jgi:hypothetical protein
MKLLGLLESTFYFAIGKPSPWGTPDVPPTPPSDLSVLPEVFLYKRARRVLPALLSPCGNLPIQLRVGDPPQMWYVIEDWKEILLSYSGSYPINPTHLYVELELEPEDLSSPSYRSTALYADLRFHPGVPPGSVTLTPSLIEDTGVALWVAYHLPVVRLPGRTQTVQVLLPA